MIVNAHTHLGSCNIYGGNVTEKELIDSMDENNVRAAIVQPFPGAPDPVSVHNRIYNMAKAYPGRIFGMVNLNPHMDRDSYRKEAFRCIRELGFTAIKLHPEGHAVSLLSDTADMVFKLADELNVPVMVHTGHGTPFALPSLSITAARKYPNLRIILAHAGFGIYTPEAYVAATVCKNIYLETSWCIGEDIAWLIKELGADRIMMGADLNSNLPVEIAKYKALGLAEDFLDKCLYGTAKDVFKLAV